MKPITSLQPDHELSVEPVPAIVSCDIGFDELFATQRDATTRLAYLLTGSASHADEAVQESFARVYERWNAIDSPPAFVSQAAGGLGCAGSPNPPTPVAVTTSAVG